MDYFCFAPYFLKISKKIILQISFDEDQNKIKQLTHRHEYIAKKNSYSIFCDRHYFYKIGGPRKTLAPSFILELYSFMNYFQI